MAGAALAMTMGDPAGIGGEIALAAWRRGGLPPFYLIDDPARLVRLAKRLSVPVPIAEISQPGDAASAFTAGLPVLPLSRPVEVEPGRPTIDGARAAIESIDRAIDHVMDGLAAAMVTNPVHKESLYAAGFKAPGHTEYLAERAGLTTPSIMMLAVEGLRVVPVTIHVSLTKAIASLSPDIIIHAATVTAAALKNDFGIAAPRLAVAGLNPHAGEGGHMGREEIDTIAPAIRQLTEHGIDVAGPLAPDTMFHDEARRTYDAAICMYHDQALIPLKTLDFHHGVNITLGLPFIRTSPDHGTAFDIAGTGTANPESLVAAVALADRMARARRAARAGEPVA